jgi:hypothetical protein
MQNANGKMQNEAILAARVVPFFIFHFALCIRSTAQKNTRP